MVVAFVADQSHCPEDSRWGDDAVDFCVPLEVADEGSLLIHEILPQSFIAPRIDELLELGSQCGWAFGCGP